MGIKIGGNQTAVVDVAENMKKFNIASETIQDGGEETENRGKSIGEGTKFKRN